MVFLKSFLAAFVVAGALAVPFTQPSSLDVNNLDSIKAVASGLAHGAMSYYNGNVSSDPKMVGDLPDPYYWWQAGALWGAMLDYYHYTGDPTYNEVITQALTAKVNTGPNFDFMPPEHASEEGNDDLGFWGFAVMAAAERNFPQPNPDVPAWMQMGINIFDSLISRWNTTNCGGGLLWQIYESNPNGLNYKNSVSNGGLFQLAARLGRATGEQKYLDWANKVWDWSVQVGFLDADLKVYDGADARDDCSKVNPLSFTYSTGIYLYGAAVMANHTGDAVWHDRAAKMLNTSQHFFGPFDNSTNIMYEPACETVGTCNTDMKTFKGYLSRFMYKTAQELPELKSEVLKLMNPTANAAAKACDATDSSVTCGQKWYIDGNDKSEGLGQMMSSLEAVQGFDPSLLANSGEFEIEAISDRKHQEVVHHNNRFEGEIFVPGLDEIVGGMDHAEVTIDWEETDVKDVNWEHRDTVKIKINGELDVNDTELKKLRKQKLEKSESSAVVGDWGFLALILGSQIFWGIV